METASHPFVNENALPLEHSPFRDQLAVSTHRGLESPSRVTTPADTRV